jgi:hypothetical protein
LVFFAPFTQLLNREVDRADRVLVILRRLLKFILELFEDVDETVNGRELFLGHDSLLLDVHFVFLLLLFFDQWK